MSYRRPVGDQKSSMGTLVSQGGTYPWGRTSVSGEARGVQPLPVRGVVGTGLWRTPRGRRPGVDLSRDDS